MVEVVERIKKAEYKNLFHFLTMPEYGKNSEFVNEKKEDGEDYHEYGVIKKGSKGEDVFETKIIKNPSYRHCGVLYIRSLGASFIGKSKIGEFEKEYRFDIVSSDPIMSEDIKKIITDNINHAIVNDMN